METTEKKVILDKFAYKFTQLLNECHFSMWRISVSDYAIFKVTNDFVDIVVSMACLPHILSFEVTLSYPIYATLGLQPPKEVTYTYSESPEAFENLYPDLPEEIAHHVFYKLKEPIITHIGLILDEFKKILKDRSEFLKDYAKTHLLGENPEKQ